MRPIDADALKDKLQQHHDFYVMAWGGFSKMPISDKKRVDEITNCIAEVVNAPTIDALSEWIPCSERLPERDGDYLATLHHKWPDREYKTVEIEEFRNGGFDENKYIKVVAWTPKPAPWEGADDE